MYFPADLKDTFEIQEVIEELTLATMEGFKSKNDDCVDNISQLASLTPWKPSAEAPKSNNNKEGIWAYEDDDDIGSNIESYIV